MGGVQTQTLQRLNLTVRWDGSVNESEVNVMGHPSSYTPSWCRKDLRDLGFAFWELNQVELDLWRFGVCARGWLWGVRGGGASCRGAGGSFRV